MIIPFICSWSLLCRQYNMVHRHVPRGFVLMHLVGLLQVRMERGEYQRYIRTRDVQFLPLSSVRRSTSFQEVLLQARPSALLRSEHVRSTWYTLSTEYRTIWYVCTSRTEHVYARSCVLLHISDLK